MRWFIWLCLLPCVLTSCASDGDSKKLALLTQQEIQGRDEGGTSPPYARPSTYRIKTPVGWVRKDPLQEESIVDTTKALCEFTIPNDEGGQVRITIHSFPSESIEERIPPRAQIARWKRQFTELDASTMLVIPQAYSGFSGLLFEGSGVMNESQTAVMGWSMQVAPEHYSTLTLKLGMSRTPEERCSLRQMRADFTIKAVGPKYLVDKHRRSIMAFARSFELIEEMPAST